MARKYLSLDRLTEYDALIKGKINEGDEGVKSYVDTEIAKMASSSHTHDDRYYTETEIDDKLSTINTSISNITSGSTAVKNAEHAASADSATTATKATQDGDGKVIADTYETKDDANTKLQEAKEYADTKVSGLASTSSVESAISTHNTSSDAHSDIREALAAVKEDVDAFFKDATLSAEAKDTLKEIQDYITSDVSAAAEMLASINGKADKVHTHVISDVSGLQDALDTNNEAIEGLTETIENVKEDAANQAVIVLSEAQKGIDANTDRIEALETVATNKADKEHTHSWNDLEDRPFYEIISGDVLLEERTVNFSNPYNNAYIATINASLELTQGNEYTVLWDRVPYTLIFDTQNNSLGNPYLVGGPDSGEPFFISIGGNVTVFAETQGEHTFAIYANYNCEVKQLDEKYIPDTNWNNLLDRPFYENISGDILLEEQTVNCSESTGNGYSVYINASLAVTEGNEYTVIWDGIPYKVIAGNNTLGNMYWGGSSPNTGEPFFIGVSSDSLYVAAETQGNHTLAIYSDYNYELKQLDSKFIPDISWNNLKDRPFYEIFEGNVLLDEQTVDCSESYGNGYFTQISKVVTFTTGEEYTVIWDGIPYKITPTSNKWGNTYLEGSSDNTGEPFFINIDNSSIYIFAETQGEHTFAICSSNYNYELKQLDEKFIPNISADKLPNISWNNLTDRPFYENISGDVFLEEQTITLSGDNGNGRPFTNYTILSPLQLTAEKYIVVWDGVPYETVYTGGKLGNLNAYNSQAPDSGEPFFIGVSSSSLHICCAEQGEHTFAIYSSNYNYEFKQLDEKFIPNISTDKLPDISWNNLTDKPFYESITGDILLEEQPVNLSSSNSNGYYTYINASLAVTQGNEYTVIWDCVPYKVTVKTTSGGSRYLGNLYWSGSSDNTGEPFFIGFNNDGTLYVATDSQGEHTLAIYSDYNYELKQLDEKFIPNISTDKLPDISWNKISDKPFYESISGDVLLEEQTITTSEDNGNGRYFTDLDLTSLVDLKLEEKYIVVWDDIPYETVYTGKLGNVNAYHSQAPDTGEPFFISGGGLHLEICCPEEGEHTFAIYSSNYNYELKQLDEKFIPNISTDKLPDISWNNLTDRPFYENISGDILLEEQTVNCSDPYGNGYCTMISRVLSITEGTEYTIIWDGVPYKVIARTSGSSNSNDLGNKYIYNGVYGNTGEPFFIGVDGSSFHIYCAEQGEHTLEVYSNYNYEVKQLDEKFIPNINWEKISNKPFYESTSGDVLLEEQRLNFTSDRIFKELSFIDNTIYTVIWDGVEYECLKEEGKSYIGNFSIVVPSSPDTGEPFFIDTPSIYCKTQGEHVVAIYSDYNCEVKKLDEKFIPDISWNNLKDKPFYENISGDVLLEKQIVNCSESTANGYSTNINASLAVTEGKEYTIIWDEVPYTLTAVGTTLGNIYWNGSSTNTGEPFFIGVSSSSLYIATENQEEHTLEVYSNYNYEVKQLDEKFIPDNIQRSTDNNLTTTDKTIVGAINELNNSGVGKSTTGTVYIIDDIEVTAFDGAEIFNNYSNNIATGMYSHAEGSSTTATGNYSHAEGALTKASSSYSHAEGHSTTASGAYSHAEGQYVKALSSYSHAEGRNTIASGENQHVQGKFNIEDTENKYAHIVGNGKTNKSRSNAHTLDWDGNAWYKGDLFVGGTSQDDATKLVTEAEVDVKLQDKANATHTHAISDITDLETTLANAASAISANTNSISANSNAISSLQTIVNDIQEISSEEIQALFNT